MDTWGIFAIILSFVGGIIVGWTARTEDLENHKKTESESVFRPDLKYIKRGFGELSRTQKTDSLVSQIQTNDAPSCKDEDKE